MPISRRAVLTAATGLAMTRTAIAARPEPAGADADLIDAAKKEGKIAWYTADDLVLATRVSKAFEAKYGMTVQLERSGAERIYQRIAQEYSSNSARSMSRRRRILVIPCRGMRRVGLNHSSRRRRRSGPQGDRTRWDLHRGQVHDGDLRL